MNIIFYNKHYVKKTKDGYKIQSAENNGVLSGFKQKLYNSNNNNIIKINICLDLKINAQLVGFKTDSLEIQDNSDFDLIKTFHNNDLINKTLIFKNNNYKYIGLLYSKSNNKEYLILKHFNIIQDSDLVSIKHNSNLVSIKQNNINNSDNFLNEYFDKIYFINLEHRIERRQHILSQLKKLKFDFKKIQWIKAVYYPLRPQIGCAMSHMNALKDAYIHKYSKILILEDDFTFNIDVSELNYTFLTLKNNYPNWDIIQLSSVNEKSNPTNIHFIHKVLKADTTSGYAVQYKNIILLFNIFKTCLNPDTLNKGNRYAIDVAWEYLQPKLQWLLFKPYIGYQNERFESDIEQFRSIRWNI
jgi:GR25 family glycosyltransferase involved in LPS biosynthesis